MRRPSWPSILGLCFVILSGSFANADLAKTKRLIVRLNSSWRSSSRAIDEKTIQDQIIGGPVPRVSEPLMRNLSQTSIPEILLALKELSKDPLNYVNREMAINIVKVKVTADALARRRLASPRTPLEVIAGYTQKQLDDLVADLPPVTAENTAAIDFDYLEELLNREIAHNNVFKNDLYVFRIAYAFWVRGLANDIQVISEIFLRGNKEISYLSAVGQDDVIRLLRTFKFTHDQIEHLKRVPGFEKADPRFFEDLLKWRFAGDVWARKPGSLMAANTTYMTLKGNIFDILFAEAPALAQVGLAVGSGTIASRISSLAPHLPFVEGGARRYLGGLLRAKYAFINGFVGTSNLAAAQLFGIPAMGSGGNHAAIGIADALLGDEKEFHLTMMDVFDWRPLRFLIDTFDALEGTRKVIQATRGEFGGLRSDSNLPGKTTVETLFDIQEILIESGFTTPDRPQISHTDDMNEYSIETLLQAGAPIDSGLVGGRLAYAPNLSPVMKAVAVIGKDGILRPISKTAVPEKSHYPMPKQWGRKTVAGKFVGDIAVLEGESLPDGYEPQMDLYMKQGQLIRALPALSEQVSQRKFDLSRMPAEVLDIHSGPGVYPVTYSEELNRIRTEYIAAHNPHGRLRVGIYPGSFDGTHSGHMEVAQRMKVIYGLDQVLIVPTGDRSIASPGYQPKNYRLSAQARVQMLKEKFRNEPWVTIYEGESNSPVPLTTYQNLKNIEKLLPQDADIYVIFGQDLMPLMANFSNAKEMLETYNWIFAERKTPQDPPGGIRTPADLARKLGTNHITRDASGNLLRTPEKPNFRILELQPLRTSPTSSTELRKTYDAAKINFFLYSGDDSRKTVTASLHGDGEIYSEIRADSVPLLDPYRILPRFFTGWCYTTCKGEGLAQRARSGQNIFGILEKPRTPLTPEVKDNLKRLRESGVKIISTDEFEEVKFLISSTRSDWAGTLNILAEIQIRSRFLDQVLNNKSEVSMDCNWRLQ